MATIDLDAIQVASPCSVPWESMTGDERVRFCGQCRLNVYDLTTLTSDEARALIEKSEGRVCVRFFRRRDGTVVTRDCPVGVRTVRRRRAGIAAGIAAAAGFAGGLVQGLRGRALPVAASPHDPTDPGEMIMGAVPAPLHMPEPPPAEPLEEVMGDVAYPEEPPQEIRGKVALGQPGDE